MLVEPHGWGWLRVADRQAAVSLRVSYVSDVLADLIDVISRAASGAEAAEARLGLEPGEAVLRIERRDSARSLVRVIIETRFGPEGAYSFPVETRSLARLGLDLVASVDREWYLTSWAPQASWPTEGVERLSRLARQ